ncbi:MAG TPA: hypothetical protein VIA81_06450 [Acidimicrobiia bacterium]|jgi:hypothetical protein
MSQPDQRPTPEELRRQASGGGSRGLVIAAVVLVLAIVAAIWYFQAAGQTGADTDVSISIDPNQDPGVATTISP